LVCLLVSAQLLFVFPQEAEAATTPATSESAGAAGAATTSFAAIETTDSRAATAAGATTTASVTANDWQSAYSVLINAFADFEKSGYTVYNQSVIGDTRLVSEENWDSRFNWMDNGIRSEKLCYWLHDINGDGTPELFIGTQHADDTSGATTGSTPTIYEIYTVQDGKAVLIVQPLSRYEEVLVYRSGTIVVQEARYTNNMFPIAGIAFCVQRDWYYQATPNNAYACVAGYEASYPLHQNWPLPFPYSEQWEYRRLLPESRIAQEAKGDLITQTDYFVGVSAFGNVKTDLSCRVGYASKHTPANLSYAFYLENYVPNHMVFTPEEALPLDKWPYAVIKTVSLPYRPTIISGLGVSYLRTDWSLGWLNGDAREFNYELAKVCMLLSRVVYVDDENRQLNECLRLLGIPEAGAKRVSAAGVLSSIRYSITSMRLAGSDKNLVVVVCQGTNDLLEWGSNFEIQEQDGDHSGFRRATDELLADIKAYMLEKSIPLDAENTVYLVTGHSRGGAVSNILAKELVAGGYGKPEQIFAYTFASPNTTLNNVTPADHPNIFNIIDPEDPVCSIPTHITSTASIMQVARRYGVTMAYSKNDFPTWPAGQKYHYPTGWAEANSLNYLTGGHHHYDSYVAWLEFAPPVRQ